MTDGLFFFLVVAVAVGARLVLWLRQRTEDRQIQELTRASSPAETHKLPDLPRPPEDPHDAAGWDHYWERDLAIGGMITGLSDMMASDETLLVRMASRGVQTVLCVGNGLSAEASVLANVGFTVTALNRSELATRVARTCAWPREHPMHRTRALADRPPGTVTFVAGDLFDAAACSGPFDAVIERLTVQQFSSDDRVRALERLVARLARRGMLVSQVHMGWWRPGQPREHFAKEWLRDNGFSEDPEAERMFILRVTTG